MSIIAFLKFPTTATADNFVSDLRRSIATGLRVSVHGRALIPTMRNGITVNPSTETTVWVRETRVVRLPEPWGGCSFEQFSSGSHFDEYQDAFVTDACLDICAQNQVVLVKSFCFSSCAAHSKYTERDSDV